MNLNKDNVIITIGYFHKTISLSVSYIYKIGLVTDILFNDSSS